MGLTLGCSLHQMESQVVSAASTNMPSSNHPTIGKRMAVPAARIKSAVLPSTGAEAEGAMKIGEVAERSGLPVKTIRFYSDEGLIWPIGRSQGGYRLFDRNIDQDLELIRALRAMEIPLSDVRQILDARRAGVCTCDELKTTIAAKAEEIQQRILGLKALRSELNILLKSWEDCGGSKRQARP